MSTAEISADLESVLESESEDDDMGGGDLGMELAQISDEDFSSMLT